MASGRRIQYSIAITRSGPSGLTIGWWFHTLSMKYALFKIGYRKKSLFRYPQFCICQNLPVLLLHAYFFLTTKWADWVGSTRSGSSSPPRPRRRVVTRNGKGCGRWNASGFLGRIGATTRHRIDGTGALSASFNCRSRSYSWFLLSFVYRVQDTQEIRQKTQRPHQPFVQHRWISKFHLALLVAGLGHTLGPPQEGPGAWPMAQTGSPAAPGFDWTWACS